MQFEASYFFLFFEQFWFFFTLLSTFQAAIISVKEKWCHFVRYINLDFNLISLFFVCLFCTKKDMIFTNIIFSLIYRKRVIEFYNEEQC